MMETVQIRRLRWLLWILLAWTLAIFARLVLLQVFHHDELLHLAQQQLLIGHGGGHRHRLAGLEALQRRLNALGLALHEP